MAASTEVEKLLSGYQLPTWSDFELGKAPVYWELESVLRGMGDYDRFTEDPGIEAGATMKIYFNPKSTSLKDGGYAGMSCRLDR